MKKILALCLFCSGLLTTHAGIKINYVEPTHQGTADYFPAVCTSWEIEEEEEQGVSLRGSYRYEYLTKEGKWIPISHEFYTEGHDTLRTPVRQEYETFKLIVPIWRLGENGDQIEDTLTDEFTIYPLEITCDSACAYNKESRYLDFWAGMTAYEYSLNYIRPQMAVSVDGPWVDMPGITRVGTNFRIFGDENFESYNYYRVIISTKYGVGDGGAELTSGVMSVKHLKE